MNCRQFWRYSLIRRQTITAQVINYILDLIRKGQVKPGERLPTEKQLKEIQPGVTDKATVTRLLGSREYYLFSDASGAGISGSRGWRRPASRHP